MEMCALGLGSRHYLGREVGKKQRPKLRLHNGRAAETFLCLSEFIPTRACLCTDVEKEQYSTSSIDNPLSKLPLYSLSLSGWLHHCYFGTRLGLDTMDR